MYDVRTGLGDQLSSPEVTKSERLSFRASPAQRKLLERAALANNKSLTEYVLEVACEAAENDVLDQRIFFVDEKAFSKFEKALNAPAKVSKEMRDLLSRSAPWE